MAIESDLSLNFSKFDPKSVDNGTAKFNDTLMEIMAGGPRWWEVGAEAYRGMRDRGETPLPKPVMLESGKKFEIPSRDSGRTIPCRYFVPESGDLKGVYYHIHGGGWVLQTHESQDPMLNQICQEAGVLVISVGYRLAPEYSFPKGPEDCYDAAEWLVDNAKKQFGAELMFIGGESAGGHLSCVTAFHLLRAKPSFALRGLVLNFGCFDLSFLPQVHTFKKSETLVLDHEIMEHFLDAFLPDISVKDRKHPSISPLYEDLTKLKLPSALLTCGTEDCLLDDSVFLAAKWQMAGGEAILKIYPGSPHGFIMFPVAQVENAKKGMNDVVTYLKSKLG